METIQKFLRNQFSEGIFSENSNESRMPIIQAFKNLMKGKTFRVIEDFNIYVSISVEEMQIAIRQFCIGAGYRISKIRNVELSHFGTDLSFENDKNKLFVVISQYDTHFRISITEVPM